MSNRYLHNKYIGHSSQLSGVEEHRLVGGKGDGMRLLQVNNGKGLQFVVSLDRAADISRLQFKGENFGYFSPAGYVAPAYYDSQGDGFLKSFTAGFLTTCGLNAVGAPCVDEGEELPLHGSISNTPAEHTDWMEDDEKIVIHARINQAGIFAHKLIMHRTILCEKNENTITISDRIENLGDKAAPVMILYHLNMGYPLLSEDSELYIPSHKVVPRNEHAKKDLDTWDRILEPQAGFEEQCYYHQFQEEGKAAIFNPNIEKGLVITFDKDVLPYFTEWKMMGLKDYVLGLEPGNCHPDGRDVMRKDKTLTFLEPDTAITYEVKLTMVDGQEPWKQIKGESGE